MMVSLAQSPSPSLPPTNNTVYESDDDGDDDDDTVDSQSTTQTANRTTTTTADGDDDDNADLLAIRQQAFELLNKSGGPSSREDFVSWPTNPQLLDEIQQQQQAARRFEEQKLLERQQQEAEEQERRKQQQQRQETKAQQSWREKLAKESERQSRLRAKIGSPSPHASPTKSTYAEGKKGVVLQAGGGAAAATGASSYQHQSAGESAAGTTSSYGASSYQSSSSSSFASPQYPSDAAAARVAHDGGDLSVTALFTNCVSSICKSTYEYASQTDVMSLVSQSYQSFQGMNMEQRMNGSYDTIDTSQHGYGKNNSRDSSRNNTVGGSSKYGGYTNSSSNNFRGRYSD